MTRWALAAAILAAAVPGSALAQGGSGSATDPEMGSPSGTIYELPLDAARGDAAPRRGGRSGQMGRSRGDGRTGAGGTGGESSAAGGTSPIRSENNFGSSSQVPGVDASDAEATAHGGKGAGETGNGRGSDGAEDEALRDAARSAPGALPAAQATDDEGPSWPLVLALVGLIVLVGWRAGVLAGRARRA